ncbi:LysR substrate-binding domain-containing protein [Pontibacterium sp.]|uniref:LysR substrate-binding domain-containing protein n=1 Tax=Pontibacterium sp. TaxID=2036026 RepID=UPI00356866AC
MCQSDYLARAGRPESAKELSQHDCVIMGTSLTNQHWQLRTEKGEVTIPVKGRYAVGNMQLAVKALTSSMGVALVPYPLVHRLLQEGALVQVLEGCEPALKSIYVVYPNA